MPKVFVSYSWKLPETVRFATELVERLIDKDVEVIFDRYDLKPGQDKYLFMEKSVRSEDVDKVLIICDGSYKEKADGRDGGVGDETYLITPEVYRSAYQERYIPILREKDEFGRPMLPAYLESRIGVDFSNDDEFEENFDVLLRNLYGVPALKRPKRGSPPDFSNDEPVELTKLKRKAAEVHRVIKQGKAHQLQVKEFQLEFVESILAHCNDKGTRENGSGDEVLAIVTGIEELVKYRDVFYDVLTDLAWNNDDVAAFAAESLQFLRNQSRARFPEGVDRADSEGRFSRLDFLLWEMVLGCVAIMLYSDRFSDAGRFIRWTFFLRYGGAEEGFNISMFRYDSSLLESLYKPTTGHASLISIAAHMVLNRGKEPAVTAESLKIADQVIYQVIDLIETENYYRWAPITSIYTSDIVSFWRRLLSAEQCGRYLSLFGVSDLKELLKKLNCSSGLPVLKAGFKSGPMKVLDCIKAEELGSMP